MSNKISAPSSDRSRAAWTLPIRSARSRAKSTRCSQSTPVTAPGEAMGVLWSEAE